MGVLQTKGGLCRTKGGLLVTGTDGECCCEEEGADNTLTPCAPSHDYSPYEAVIVVSGMTDNGSANCVECPEFDGTWIAAFYSNTVPGVNWHIGTSIPWCTSGSYFDFLVAYSAYLQCEAGKAKIIVTNGGDSVFQLILDTAEITLGQEYTLPWAGWGVAGACTTLLDSVVVCKITFQLA